MPLSRSLYIVLAQYNELIPHEEWEYYERDWGTCPECDVIHFEEHKDGCSVAAEIK